MLHKLSVTLVAWHYCTLLSAQPLHPKRVIVTASLEHSTASTPRAMVFNFLNPFIHMRKAAAFDENNALQSQEEMVFTQNMTVMYNNTFINLLVSPGDSVHLSIDAALLARPRFEWLKISGDHAQESTQINRWHHYFNTTYSKSFGPAGSLSAMTDSVQIWWDRSRAILDSYALVNDLTPDARQWAMNDLRCTVSYQATDYLSIKDSVTGNMMPNHALYQIPLFDQYNPGGFRSMMFPYHLSAYAYTLMKTDSSIAMLQRSLQYRQATEQAMILLLKEPKGLSRDYMLFNYLTTMITRSPDLPDSLRVVPEYFSDPVVYGYYLRAIGMIRNPSLAEQPINGLTYLNNDGTTTLIPATEVLQFFAKKYRGRVIYLDVYATWCVPCLREMEYMPKRKAKVDTAAVVFINLCLQSEKKNWRDLVKKKKITGENYFMGDDASKLFMGMYRIGGFPTYMLMDKKGKLSTDKAPPPSEENAFLSMMEKLIQQ